MEKAGRNPCTSYFFRERTGGLGNVLSVVARKALERRVEAVPVFQTYGSNESAKVWVFGIVLLDEDELVGIGKWQRPQENRVNSREDSAVSADSERQGQNHGGRKRRRFAEETHGGLEIGERAVQDSYAVDIAHFFFDLLLAAEFQHRPAPCFLR